MRVINNKNRLKTVPVNFFQNLFLSVVKCYLGLAHRYLDIFDSATFSFTNQKFPRSHVAYSNQIRLSARARSGFTLEKLGAHIVPPYWFIVRQETGHDFAASWDSKTPSTRYRISYGFSFSTLESRFENLRICCRIRRMGVVVSRIRKEKTCGLKNIRICKDGALK